MNHETVYKDLFWILLKHDYTNLGVNEFWGKIYLARVIKLVIPIFFVCNTVKSSNLFSSKFFYGTKSKRKLCRCI